jgi:CRP/FNR family transcriptional regulator
MSGQESHLGFIHQLQTISFFKGLDSDLLSQLASHAQGRHYAVGEMVFLEGEKSYGLYFLESGFLKVVKMSPSGREQVLLFLKPGQSFNEIGAFTTHPNPATVIVLEAARVWLIPKQEVMRLLRSNPDFAQHVIESMAERMQYLVMLVEDLSLRSVMGRLARLILDSATEDILHRPRWYTQSVVAARLGTVTDVIQRTLRRLEADGLIEVKREVIRIKKREQLEAMAR